MGEKDVVSRQCLLHCVFHKESKISQVGINIKQRAMVWIFWTTTVWLQSFSSSGQGKGRFKAKGKSHSWCSQWPKFALAEDHWEQIKFCELNVTILAKENRCDDSTWFICAICSLFDPLNTVKLKIDQGCSTWVFNVANILNNNNNYAIFLITSIMCINYITDILHYNITVWGKCSLNINKY